MTSLKDKSEANTIFKIVDSKVDPQSNTLGRSSCTPCILNVRLEGAELQGGQPHGAGDEPKAGYKLWRVRVVPEIHAVCARIPG